MIYYFSGTGNSRWAARQIAARLHDTAQDISKLNQLPDLTHESQIGLVFPIYAWGAPEPVPSFVKKLPKTKAFTFAVCTCFEEAGYAMKKLSDLYPFRSSYSLVMPNNYIISADVDDAQTIRKKIQDARQAIQTLTDEVAQHQTVYRVQEGKHAGLKSGLVNFGFNRFARNTKAFYATDHCNSCGLRVQNCPASTITMTNGKPVWGKTCYQCLGCINACPQRAIEYGKSTQKHGRYTIDAYVDD